MNKKIWLSSPHMGLKELHYVNEAFETNWIAPLGPLVDQFEHDIEQYIGNDSYVAALNSGTAAIHLALILLGVGPGDEVICQSMTFSASANPIVYQGATPVFVDSEEQTYNMSPYYLEEAIKARIKAGKLPKAIILVHLYGMPAALTELLQIAENYQIPVIEDAAEALGSSYENKKLGTFGDLAIFSFNGNKIITTSGGGALVSKNNQWVKKARFLATQAKDNAPYFQHSEIGYNYRMSNVCAGIGCGQMSVLDERVQQRRRNFDFYSQQLSAISEIKLLPEPGPAYFSNRWLSTISIEEGTVSKELIMEKLAEKNIESRCLWKPMHLQPVFKSMPYYGEAIAENIFNNGLCLPSGSNLTWNDLEFIVENLKGCFSKIINKQYSTT